jgi:hypothetical protein
MAETLPVKVPRYCPCGGVTNPDGLPVCVCSDELLADTEAATALTEARLARRRALEVAWAPLYPDA